MKEVKRAAELLGLSELLEGLDSVSMGELYLGAQVEKQIHDTRQARLRTLALGPDNFLTGETARRRLQPCSYEPPPLSLSLSLFFCLFFCLSLYLSVSPSLFLSLWTVDRLR